MAVEYIETREVPLTSLTRFPGNAKRGDVGKIRESIRRTGQYRSIVVRQDGDKLVILAGNHTFDAVALEGTAAIRAELIRCTDDEARRINLADNRLAELGSFDTDALAELLSYLDDDYEGTGYDEAFVESLLTPPDEEPTEDEPTKTVGALPDCGVIVECEDTEAQNELAHRLANEGWRVRILKITEG